MFLFGAAALVGRAAAAILGLVLFALALLSKESAVILLPLYWLVGRVAPADSVRHARRMVTGSILLTRDGSFRFSDGSFSLHAPFWITWPRGIGRVLWIWGWLALLVIWWRAGREQRPPALALVWIAIALLPYSFLTYSTAIPSRQTYLATVGLSVIFGLALDTFSRREAVAAAVALMLAHNIGYLWVKNERQFWPRAEPTERLIRLAREVEGPIWVQCFPRTDWIAKEAVHLGRPPRSILVWSAPKPVSAALRAVYCFK